jgi:tRNA pseudouridine38-40 synthase
MGVEYDGTHFCGWQQQPGLRTLEESLTAAISLVADHPIELVCGGRTDAGVHAAGQVVHFETSVIRSARAWVLGTNAHLERKLSVAWARPVPDFFHARFSALRRHYRYTIFNRGPRSALHEGRSAWVMAPLDVSRMHAGGQHLVGEHDFSAFRAAECQSKSPVRRLEALQVSRQGLLVHIDVVANAFLHHMVRNIAGLLIEVGRGLRQPEEVRTLLLGRDRRRNAPTAEPQGLMLRRIDYPPAFRLPDPV